MPLGSGDDSEAFERYVYLQTAKRCKGEDDPDRWTTGSTSTGASGRQGAPHRSASSRWRPPTRG
eukprot:11470804-Alexandrium_andersonii.AAC.1